MAVKTVDQSKLEVTGDSAVGSPCRFLKWIPSALWLLAAVLLLVSPSLPYWGMVMHAPQYPESQYPGGLKIRVFVNTMVGGENPGWDDVKEINELNHYIGMKPLDEAAQFERSIAIPAIILMAGLLGVAALWRRRWTWLLVIPAFTFPFVFLADLAFWLNSYGQNLDPSAPFSSAIHPFTPPIFGSGTIGQFDTVAYIGIGWYLAVLASAFITVALVVLWVSTRPKSEKAS